MLVLGSQLIGVPVMSLQTGTELARTKDAIIDPHTLNILAYELEGSQLDQHPSLLRIADVRELGELGMIVDSSDEFIGVDDVLKIRDIYNLRFPLVGLAVYDDQKRKLGKVSSYTVEMGSFVIQQLNVKRPLLKSLSDTELLVHRSQIIEITDSKIVVKSPAETTGEPIATAVRAYVNPFRQPGNTQPESITTKRD